MTIADKLALLEQTKEAQRVKLGLPKSLPFSEYIKFMQAWTPAELFKNGEQGVWLDPSDLSTMFQEVDGTVPVTKDGDPVALIKDKSGNGNHATQPTASSRPIYRTDGYRHWLDFDGIDDLMIVRVFQSPINQPYRIDVASYKQFNGNQAFIIDTPVSSRVYILENKGSGGLINAGVGAYINVVNYDVNEVTSVYFDGEGSKAVANSGNVFNANLGGNYLQDVAIGSRRVNLTACAKMALYSLVIAGNATGISEQTRSHLANKAGVTL